MKQYHPVIVKQITHDSYDFETPKKQADSYSRSLRGSFNTSPRSFLKGYFREGQLFKESARNITQIHSRFIPKLVEDKNNELAKQMIDKKVDNAYDRFIKRQDKEKLTHYFNQDLNKLVLNEASTTFETSTVGTFQRRIHLQRTPCAPINELSKSLS